MPDNWAGNLLCSMCAAAAAWGASSSSLAQSALSSLSLCEQLREVGWRRLRRRWKGGTHPAARTAGRKKKIKTSVCMCACRISNFLANLYTCCFDTSVFKSITDGVFCFFATRVRAPDQIQNRTQINFSGEAHFCVFRGLEHLCLLLARTCNTANGKFLHQRPLQRAFGTPLEMQKTCATHRCKCLHTF
jgi:hypothetical protein